MEECIQFRTDTAANWLLANTVLLSGELGYDSTNKKLKVGDGVTPWALLPYLCIPCEEPVVPPPPPPPPPEPPPPIIGSSGSFSGPTGACKVFASGSGALACGLSVAYEGGQGAYEYVLDLHDRTGTLGIWFGVMASACRITARFPTDASGNDIQETQTYTSGWRGEFSLAPAIGAVTDGDPSLLFPRSLGPYRGLNGHDLITHAGYDAPMVGEDLLLPWRLNPGWGYFTFYRDAQAAVGRYARICVEAPLADAHWSCGPMCDWGSLQATGSAPLNEGNVPLSATASIILNTSLQMQWRAVDTRQQQSPLLSTSFEATLEMSDSGQQGQTPNQGRTVYPRYDWGAILRANAVAFNDEGYLRQYGPISSWNVEAPIRIRESLYHPLTGLWAWGDLLNFDGTTVGGSVKMGNEPPRVCT
jgi:hypothetical protein